MRFVIVCIPLLSLFAGCGGGGYGGGSPTNVPPTPEPPTVYQVSVVSDPALPEGSCTAPLFAPGDLAEQIHAVSANLSQHRSETGFIGDTAPLFAFPRHLDDGGPTMTLDSGLELTDDIRFVVETNQDGQYVSVQFKGQPLIGAESLSHESEVVAFSQSVDPLDDQEFVAHVDSMQPIPMWELEGHLGGDRVREVGNFCLGDMVFAPLQ